jgi:hypothetical protein
MTQLVLAVGIAAIAGGELAAQFVAPLPRQRAATADRNDVQLPAITNRALRPTDDETKAPGKKADDGSADIPNLLLPQLSTGFASDRAYVTSAIFTGHGKLHGRGFNLDVTAAKVVSKADTGSEAKRQAIKDAKGLVTTMVENGGDVGMRLYGCPNGCLPEAGGNNRSGVTTKLLFGLTAGSYASPDTADKDTKVAFGPIVQYYAAFDLTDGKKPAVIGNLIVGARAGVSSLSGGGIPDVADSRSVRYISETAALIVHGAIAFGITLTQTQSSLKTYVPGVQFTTTASFK